MPAMRASPDLLPAGLLQMPDRRVGDDPSSVTMKTLSLALVAVLVLFVAPVSAGWFSKSDTEEVQKAFTESLNKGKQRLLEQYHLLATAKELEVQKLVLLDAQGNPTKNLRDAAGFVTSFVIFWESSTRSDGYLKMNAVYDFSVRNFVDTKVAASNGVLNEDAASGALQILGALFGE